MTRRRKLAHVCADFGDQDLGRGLAQARNLFQSRDGVMKGLKRGLDPRVEGCDCFFQLLNGLYVLIDKETMMLANAAMQGIRKF